MLPPAPPPTAARPEPLVSLAAPAPAQMMPPVQTIQMPQVIPQASTPAQMPTPTQQQAPQGNMAVAGGSTGALLASGEQTLAEAALFPFAPSATPMVEES